MLATGGPSLTVDDVRVPLLAREHEQGYRAMASEHQKQDDDDMCGSGTHTGSDREQSSVCIRTVAGSPWSAAGPESGADHRT